MPFRLAQEATILELAPTGEIHPQDQLETKETAKEPEYPPITIEGYPARGATYARDKDTGKITSYKLILGHHPNPNDKKKAARGYAMYVFRIG